MSYLRSASDTIVRVEAGAAHTIRFRPPEQLPAVHIMLPAPVPHPASFASLVSRPQAMDVAPAAMSARGVAAPLPQLRSDLPHTTPAPPPPPPPPPQSGTAASIA